MKNPRDSRRKLDLWFSIVLFVMISGVAAFVLNAVTKTGADFHNELWGPAYLLMQGKSPYETSSLNPELPAVWFPMAIGVFSPLGLFGEQVALKLWLYINIAELVAIIWLAVRGTKAAHIWPIVGTFVYLFPPVINHFALGQFSITAMLCLIIAAHFAEKESAWQAAIFVALGLSKPQLGILAVFGLCVFYFKRGGLKQLIMFGLQVVGIALIMSVPLFIAHPAWISDWINSMQMNSYPWLHPSGFSILKRGIGVWAYPLWGVLTSVVLLLCLQIWKTSKPPVAMMWSMALTTIITPYIWSWDFVLLLPIWIHVFSRTSWKKRAVLLMAYLAGWLGIALIQLSENNNNIRFWWIPLWFVGIAALVAYEKPLKQKNEAASRAAS